MSSSVIKARTLESLDRRVVIKRNVELARQQATEIAARAQKEAERIVAEARREAEELLDSAKRDGYESGLAYWNEMLAAARQSRDDYIARNEPALLQLAVRIAEKLIGEELSASPEKIVTVVREALCSVARAKSVVLQLHPADGARLEHAEEAAVLQGLDDGGGEFAALVDRVRVPRDQRMQREGARDLGMRFGHPLASASSA